MNDKYMRADTITIRRLNVSQVHEQIAQGDSDTSPLFLIDVREPWEFATGHLDQAINIPLGELPMRIQQIPPNANAIFICRSGGRSMAACNFAVQAGIANPANMEGGMLAWDADQ